MTFAIFNRPAGPFLDREYVDTYTVDPLHIQQWARERESFLAGVEILHLNQLHCISGTAIEIPKYEQHQESPSNLRKREYATSKACFYFTL